VAVVATDDWYEVVDHDPFVLQQGDIIEGVEVPDPDAAYLPADEPLPFIRFRYVVIISQDCDLIAAQGHTYGLFCPAITFDELAEEGKNVKDLWNKARKQQLVHFFALPPCTVPEWYCQGRIVDLRQVYQLSLSRIERLGRARDYRVRLQSPYRYELARHFTQKITRIGLDQPLPEWSELSRTEIRRPSRQGPT
jgi:hypothetical protein